MISGLNASGIASAIRTAGQARATMDTMTRQIATGQRVASVRDDGAAWARANIARSDAAASLELASSLSVVQTGLGMAAAISESRNLLLADMRGTALAAADPSITAATRNDLQTHFTQLRTSYLTELSYGIHGPTLGLRNSSGTTWVPYSATLGVADLAWVSTVDGAISTRSFAAALGVPGTDVSTSTAAATTASSIQSVEAQMLQRAAELGGLDQRILAERSRLSEGATRLDALAASLTGADLARASAARAMAETRQQLALSTVRQAISTYSAFATGLLGNVQRTQRGILA